MSEPCSLIMYQFTICAVSFTGYNESAVLIDEFCCPDPSDLPSWSSSGSEIYLKFVTDSSEVGKGFKVRQNSL